VTDFLAAAASMKLQVVLVKFETAARSLQDDLALSRKFRDPEKG
jgi:hypothetical protein